jgi:hypothetical protein
MKDFETMKPREIEAYLREAILKTFGDEVENRSSVTASKGYYSVYIVADEKQFNFSNFRKGEAGKIAKSIRALK